MTPRPTDAGDFAEALYEQMEPLTYADEDIGWHLLIFLGAIGQMLEELDELSHADTPWVGMIDIDAVSEEALPWLAQFVGVTVDRSLSVDDQRQQIRAHVGWNRGTPETFKSMVRTRLTGSQTVELYERDTSPYHFRVVTYSDETPTEDWAVTNLIDNPSFETDTSGWFVE